MKLLTLTLMQQLLQMLPGIGSMVSHTEEF